MYWRIDTELDTVTSLEAARDFFVRTQSDASYWKWYIIALHSCIQGAFALALENGNGFLVQKPGVTAAILAAHETGAPIPAQHMDNFSRLYEKVKKAENLRSGVAPFNPTTIHDQAINSLDSLRDDLIHFNTKSCSIPVSLITNSSLHCCEVLDFHLNSGGILWHNELHLPRALLALSSLTALLRAA
jgi:hypothetical protein